MRLLVQGIGGNCLPRNHERLPKLADARAGAPRRHPRPPQEPIELAPLVISARPIAVPVENRYYRAARAAGVLVRDGIPWTGDFEQVGQPVDLGGEVVVSHGDVAAGMPEAVSHRVGKD